MLNECIFTQPWNSWYYLYFEVGGTEVQRYRMNSPALHSSYVAAVALRVVCLTLNSTLSPRGNTLLKSSLFWNTCIRSAGSSLTQELRSRIGKARSTRDCVVRSRPGDRSDPWPQGRCLESGCLTITVSGSVLELPGVLRTIFSVCARSYYHLPCLVQTSQSLREDSRWLGRDSSTWEKGAL